MLKLEILAALAVLMCGPILLWRRRDNVFGYQQVGLFVSSAIIPILGTTVIDDADPALLQRYSHILSLGAVGFAAGLLYGGSIGSRCRLPRVSFSSPLAGVPPLLMRRVRLASLAAAAALVGAYLLLGYIPLFAADRQAAKYGVGPYHAGFLRGSVLYHLALALAGAVIAVLLAVVAMRKRPRDVLLLALILVGLAFTLSRSQALTGPLVFLIAWGVQRRWRPWKLLTLVCAAFLAGAIVNQLAFVPAPGAAPSFATNVAASAPDVREQLSFLRGFETGGRQFVGLNTIEASVSPIKGKWDPTDYALQTSTGIPDVTQLASGGIRLPAPVWGYATYGYTGVVLFSFLSGIFIGWGTALVRRLVAGVQGTRYQYLNLVLAWVFFLGTFDVVAGFYFLERSSVMVTALAVALGFGLRLRPRDEPPAGAASTAVPASRALTR